ncbi:MAG: GNAT family N-acetyltransferase [Patescibacteria group bacterium]
MTEIKIFHDLAEAKRLWNKLSPQRSLYDLWDFRYCFYCHDVQPLHFYAIYEDGQAVGLLPLQYNELLAAYEFFAENFMEENRPFVKAGYEHLVPELFRLAPAVTKIFDISGQDDFTRSLPLEDYIYFLDISRFHSFGDYLTVAFPSAHKRSNFKRIFTVLEREHAVKVIHNDFKDLELLMDLNVRRFGAESYLRTEAERQPFRDLVRLSLAWHLITVEIDGEKLAASLSIVYNNIYYYLIVGSDISRVSDAFKYLTKANLELAISLGLKTFNFSLGGCNWKEAWHLDKEPQYKFIKL